MPQKKKREKPIRAYNEVLQMTKDEAAKKYRWLVKKRAYECWSRSRKNGFDLNDLIQEGYIGLLKAFDTYIYKHIHFDIYASKYVYHSILHFIRRKAPMIWYPASEADKYRLRLSRVVYMDRKRSEGNQSYDWYETLAGSMLDDHSLISYKDFIQSLTRYEQSVIRLLLQEFPQRIVALMIGSSKQAVNESLKSIRSKYIYYEKTKRFKPDRRRCQA